MALIPYSFITSPWWETKPSGQAMAPVSGTEKNIDQIYSQEIVHWFKRECYIFLSIIIITIIIITNFWYLNNNNKKKTINNYNENVDLL